MAPAQGRHAQIGKCRQFFFGTPFLAHIVAFLLSPCELCPPSVLPFFFFVGLAWHMPSLYTSRIPGEACLPKRIFRRDSRVFPGRRLHQEVESLLKDLSKRSFPKPFQMLFQRAKLQGKRWQMEVQGNGERQNVKVKVEREGQMYRGVDRNL